MKFFASSGQKSAIVKIKNLITNPLLKKITQIGSSAYLATTYFVSCEK